MTSALPKKKIQKILLLKFEGTNDISQEFLMDFYNNELGLSILYRKQQRIWKKILGDFKKPRKAVLFEVI